MLQKNRPEALIPHHIIQSTLSPLFGTKNHILNVAVWSTDFRNGTAVYLYVTTTKLK
jgi:hypothetical protein